MGQASATAAPRQPVDVFNGGGRGRIVLACDHASNFIPADYGTLGLEAAELERHIAWDPGALPVARRMAELLDAPMVASCISRLVIDCNRPVDAPDLIPETSETTKIPGNADLDAAERRRRIAVAHQPFHAAIDALLDRRERAGLESWLVSVHSFTPVYKGMPRPWEIGIIHDEDERLAAPFIERLRAVPGLTVGVNEPYSPADRVYYTLERHARARGLPCAMIEIRNDEVNDERKQRKWAKMLSGILSGLVVAGDQAAIAGTRTTGRDVSTKMGTLT
ncbi:N-formylglutamate amidohydrolase [Mesorhizobium sp. LHD-90]|uniref:N-formylglutamate amidohydrolase n=1 Tax=Mesorhizobium sp. LHD-90 TaxID=3071414 RepID=UPI0027DF6262|nr:N-formylglutamate amidohydrolase [Mesorhizobium sp. LHD-90]MDQ6432452.1 N-formylglutamate amidohydrolase [Mesorhizobium sp. LHD-90]